MGGKTWSEKEEEYFWRVVVASSAKRVGTDLAKPEKSWEILARDMQRTMGDQARREYTPTMLFEHFFQNIETGRKSPNAIIYVLEYLRRKGPDTSKISKGRVARGSRRQIRSETIGGRVVKYAPNGRPKERPTQGDLRLPIANQTSHDQQSTSQVSVRKPIRQALRKSIIDWRQTVDTSIHDSPVNPEQYTEDALLYHRNTVTADNSPINHSPDNDSLTDLHSLFSGNAEDGNPMERDSGYDSIMRDGNNEDNDDDEDDQLMVPWLLHESI